MSNEIINMKSMQIKKLIKNSEVKKQRIKRSKIPISRGEIYAESVKPLFIAVGSRL